jgi:hypothetical protein
MVDQRRKHPAIRVIGWSCDADGLWIPHLLAYITSTVDTASSGTSINGATLEDLRHPHCLGW